MIKEVVKLPVRIHERVTEMTMSLALKCNVYARGDMILKDGTSYVIEVNTLLEVTKDSLLPKSAHAMGITFSKLLVIIETSL